MLQGLPGRTRDALHEEKIAADPPSWVEPEIHPSHSTLNIELTGVFLGSGVFALTCLGHILGTTDTLVVAE